MSVALGSTELATMYGAHSADGEQRVGAVTGMEVAAARAERGLVSLEGC